jgi:uncharacterized membrane protein
MPDQTAAALTGLLIFAATVWIGGSAVIVLVARVASCTLTPEARVAFFRKLGRSYGAIASAALVVAYGAGATLVFGRPWNATLTATAVVATALVAATAVGVVQARRMSRLRSRALAEPDDAQLSRRVRSGAARAGALRGAIGGLSLALLALGVVTGS